MEEESEYSCVDSEYMSDEEMLILDNPTVAQMLLEAVKSMKDIIMDMEYSVYSTIKNALDKLEDVKLVQEEAEAELEGEFDEELDDDDDDLDVEMDEDDFDDELDKDEGDMEQPGRGGAKGPARRVPAARRGPGGGPAARRGPGGGQAGMQAGGRGPGAGQAGMQAGGRGPRAGQAA